MAIVPPDPPRRPRSSTEGSCCYCHHSPRRNRQPRRPQSPDHNAVRRRRGIVRRPSPNGIPWTLGQSRRHDRSRQPSTDNHVVERRVLSRNPKRAAERPLRRGTAVRVSISDRRGDGAEETPAHRERSANRCRIEVHVELAYESGGRYWRPHVHEQDRRVAT